MNFKNPVRVRVRGRVRGCVSRVRVRSGVARDRVRVRVIRVRVIRVRDIRVRVYYGIDY